MQSNKVPWPANNQNSFSKITYQSQTDFIYLYIEVSKCQNAQDLRDSICSASHRVHPKLKTQMQTQMPFKLNLKQL